MPPHVVIRRERIGLTARAIEREHELAREPLAKRVLARRGLELPDELGIRTELELGRDALLERPEPQLLEPVDLGLGELLQLRVRERRAAPERERLAQEPRALRRRPPSRASADEPLEARAGRAGAAFSSSE